MVLALQVRRAPDVLADNGGPTLTHALLAGSRAAAWLSLAAAAALAPVV